MANRIDKKLGKPFQVFMGGVYSAGLYAMCCFCTNTGIFECTKEIVVCKAITIGISAYATCYYFFNRSKFDDLFINIGLGYNDRYPLKKYVKHTDISRIYGFRIPAGMCLKDFEDNKEAFENFLGHKVDIRYTYKTIEIEEYLKDERTFYEYEVLKTKGKVVIVIGYTREGKLIACDLSKGEPHMLVAGETGSGKSTVIRSIIVNLLLTSNVKLHLVDLKNGTEFRMFEKCYNVVSFARNVSDAITTLNYLVKEVDRRYDMFYQYDTKDIDEYNSKFNEKLTYELLIIDEFADLQTEKIAKSLIDELGRKARACGIYMILATQRPDSKVLDGSIKANITNVLGLKTLNATNSTIVIGEKGLEKLRGKGHGIFRSGGKNIYIQSPFLSADKARKLVSKLYIEKRVEEEHCNKEITDISFLDKIC